MLRSACAWHKTEKGTMSVAHWLDLLEVLAEAEGLIAARKKQRMLE